MSAQNSIAGNGTMVMPESRVCTLSEKMSYGSCSEGANQGLCIVKLPPRYSFSIECECYTGFTGKHCEIFDITGLAMANMSSIMIFGAFCFIVVFALIFVIILCIMKRDFVRQSCCRGRRRRANFNNNGSCRRHLLDGTDGSSNLPFVDKVKDAALVEVTVDKPDGIIREKPSEKETQTPVSRLTDKDTQTENLRRKDGESGVKSLMDNGALIGTFRRLSSRTSTTTEDPTPAGTWRKSTLSRN